MVQYQITITAYGPFAIVKERETTVRKIIGSDQSKERAKEVALNSFKQRTGYRTAFAKGVVLTDNGTVELRGGKGR